MPITAADLLAKLSTTAGAAGNTTAQADPRASLGRYISTTLFPQTTLAAGITAAATTLTVASAAGFPAAAPFDILIDAERMTVTGGAGTTTWTVTRAVLGTTAATHALGATVATVNFVWDAISGDENAASVVEYRCFFIHNAHATLTAIGGVLWLASEVAGGAAVALGVDPTAASAVGAAGAQAVQVASEATAPAGVTFSAPTTKGAGLAMGDIPPGQCKAFWMRRSAANTSAVNADGCVWQFECDTNA